MAKKVHAYQLKGDYYHQKQVVAEYDKKTESTSYYSLVDILKNFDGRPISITIKEEDAVESLAQPFDGDDDIEE
nr:YonK family protein [Mycobacterium sp. E3298]